MTDPFAAARQSLERLGASGVPVRDDSVETLRRERIIGAVNQQAARVSEKRRARRFRVALLAAAAVLGGGLVVGVAARDWPGPDATAGSGTRAVEQGARIVAVDGEACRVRSASGERFARAGTELREGDTLLAPLGGQARLSLADRVDVRVSPASELRLPATPTTDLGLELVRGASSFAVKPLLAGHHFTVSTPHALVTVHGTRFSVEVEGEAPQAVTRVRVSEGRVSVASSGQTVFLTAGQRWSSHEPEASRSTHEAQLSSGAREKEDDASAVGAERGARSAEARAPSARPQRIASALGPAPDATASGAPSSSLPEETRAYVAAMAFKRQGEPRRALVALDAFVGRYPTSPLVENARVERLRLLRALGRDGTAADEARRYLADYPSGFGSDEARALAAPGPVAE